MLAIVYEHPTRKTVIKYYKTHTSKNGDIRTRKAMEDSGYKMTMRVEVPDEYIKRS